MNRGSPFALLLALFTLAAPHSCLAQQSGPASKADAPATHTPAAPTDAPAPDADAKGRAERAKALEDWLQDADGSVARQHEAQAREPAVFPATDVGVRLVHVDAGKARDVARMLQMQATRRFLVRAEDGTVSGPYDNISSFGDDVIMLHDRTALLDELATSLERSLQVMGQAAGPAQALQTVEYRPKNETVGNLLRALEPFARRIPNPSASSGGGGGDVGPTLVSNVTMLDEAGVLVLRDTPDHVAEMTALLARLDVPAPQVMLTCLIIQENPQADGSLASPTVPDDLARDLRQLLPVTALQRAGQAALRVAVVPGHDVIVSGTLDDAEGNTSEFKLKLMPAGFDRERGTLSLTKCAFDIDGKSLFDTSAVLTAGENTVLGASGRQPFFIVLRFMPLDH